LWTLAGDFDDITASAGPFWNGPVCLALLDMSNQRCGLLRCMSLFMALNGHGQPLRRGRFVGVKRTSRLCPGKAARSGRSRWRIAASQRCSGRHSLALDIPVQHYVEAIGGTANITRLGNIVVKTGTTERILPHAVAQRFEVSSSGALIAPTEGSTKPVSVIVTAADLATVEQYDLARFLKIRSRFR
jgi:hypothetical protein